MEEIMLLFLNHVKEKENVPGVLPLLSQRLLHPNCPPNCLPKSHPVVKVRKFFF